MAVYDKIKPLEVMNARKFQRGVCICLDIRGIIFYVLIGINLIWKG